MGSCWAQGVEKLDINSDIGKIKASEDFSKTNIITEHFMQKLKNLKTNNNDLNINSDQSDIDQKLEESSVKSELLNNDVGNHRFSFFTSMTDNLGTISQDEFWQLIDNLDRKSEESALQAAPSKRHKTFYK